MNLVDHVNRRAFLQHGTLIITAAACQTVKGQTSQPEASDDEILLKMGLVTDLHYADKAPAGTRYYRDTLQKLNEMAVQFEQEKINVLVELGDLIDAADTVETEQKYLKTIYDKFAAISKDRHCVLGNHCVDTLTKEEFLGSVEQQKSYYSFDRAGYHFIILDACYRQDGTAYGRKNFEWTDTAIPPAELEWLADDLQATKKSSTAKRTIVFAHQRLDVTNNHGVKNARIVQKLLEDSGQVLAVFQGHSHKNDLNEIGGIPYCTLAAMIEGPAPDQNSYSTLSISKSGQLKLQGFRVQKSYAWS